MEIKSYIDIEIKKTATLDGKEIERVYHFFMPVGSPFGEAYDASFETLSKIAELSKQAVEQAKPKETDGATEVEAVPVEVKK